MKNSIKIAIIFICLVILILPSSFRRKQVKVVPAVLPHHFGPLVQWSGDTLREEIIQLGRILFYDKRVSINNTISCGSCHKQEFAFSDGIQFSQGVNGLTTRNSMALSNLLWQDKFFWDGRVNSLEKQSIIPIQNKTEMGQHLDTLNAKLSRIPSYQNLFQKAFGSREITTDRIAIALAQFQKTIISSGSKFDKYLTGDTTALNAREKNGYYLFMTVPDYSLKKRGAGCVSCHSSPALQLGFSFQNNGLDSVFQDKGLGEISLSYLDNGKFKVPSLRNISLTSPYMHDGRFETLQEVIDHYNHGIKTSSTLAPFLKMTNSHRSKGLGLTNQEVNDLIDFLNTLTDTELLKRKDLSDPFQKNGSISTCLQENCGK